MSPAPDESVVEIANGTPAVKRFEKERIAALGLRYTIELNVWQSEDEYFADVVVAKGDAHILPGIGRLDDALLAAAEAVSEDAKEE